MIRQPAPAAMPGTLAANPIDRIIFVVPDLGKAIADYAALFGVAPAPMVSRPDGLSVRRATLTLANGVLLELNQPLAGPSAWRIHLRKHGRSMFGVGFRVPSVRDQSALLAGKGGRLVAGGPDQRFALFDFTDRLGTMIAISE